MNNDNPAMIIPKPFNKIRGTFKGMFVWQDMLVLFPMLLLIIWPLLSGVDIVDPSVAWPWYVYIGVMAFLTMVFMIPLPSGDKMYILFLSWLMYINSKGKYSKIAQAFPFQKIDGDTLVGSGSKAKVIKLKGVDIQIMGDSQQTYFVQNMESIFAKSSSVVNIVKASRRMDYKKWILSLKENLNNEVIMFVKKYEKYIPKYKELLDSGMNQQEIFMQNKNVFPSDEYNSIEAKLESMSINIDALSELDDSETKEISYFLSITNPDQLTLNQDTETIFDVLHQLNHAPLLLEEHALAAYISTFFKIENIKISEKPTLDEVLPKSIEFKATYYTETLKNGDKRYCSVMDIHDLPMEVHRNWWSNLIHSTDDIFIFKGKAMDSATAVDLLDKKTKISEENSLISNKTSQSLSSDKNLMAMAHTLATLQAGATIQKASFKVLLIAKSLPGLKAKKIMLRKQFRGLSGYKLNSMIFKQKIGYSNILPRYHDPVFEKNHHNVPSYILGEGYPMTEDKHQDHGAPILGRTYSGSPIMIDFKVRNKDRQNSNTVIIGKSGSGKSFAVKKMMKDYISQGINVFAIDPEDEYGVIATTMKGAHINLGANGKYKLNPLQYFGSTEGDGMNGHITFVKEFLTIAASLGQDEGLLISNYISSFFLKLKLKASVKDNKKWPVITDLVKYISNEVRKKQRSADYDLHVHQALVSRLGYLINDPLKLALWNNKTNFELRDVALTVFNVRELFENDAKEIIQAQMYLLLKFIDKKIGENKEVYFKPIEKKTVEIDELKKKFVKATSRTKIKLKTTIRELESELLELKSIWSTKWAAMVVDEAHLLIDEKNPQAVKFLYRAVKRYRKYNALTVIVTQNIKDFTASKELLRYTSAIISNAQYSFMFRLNQADISDLNDLYKDRGGITPSEKEFLNNADTGTCLAFLSSSSRQIIVIDVTYAEKQIITGGI